MFVQTVALKEVKFYAFHGFYPEENLIGNHFSVDVEVTFIPKGDSEDLSQTINYEVINTILINEMKNTQKLLETVVKNVIDTIISQFPFIISTTVGIKKISPQMQGEVGYSLVQLTYTSTN